ncbi:MAG: N-acetylmuramoyl-L-alanine amidase, partial [Myxococcaceae bacterium]
MRHLLPVALLAFAACGTESGGIDPTTGEPVLTRGTSPLEDAFERVAAEYQVPVEILKGIAFAETRVQSPGATASMTGGYGLMNLVDRSDWSGLERGAALTGVDRGRIKLDETANLRAAAAFLRDLADKSFADYPNLNPHDPADWWHAVSLYPGLDSATGAVDYAAQVFRAIDEGYEVSRPDGNVVQAGTHFDWQRHAPTETRKDAAKEYPGAYQWQASPNYTNGRSSYQYVVIHTVQGGYAGCISWFKNPASNASAHYVVRSSDGQVTQMVEHSDQAWHASCYNNKAIGIEHEGYAQNPGTWYTDAMYRESAKLTRWIADRHSIPKTRSRIIGHVEVPSQCNKNAHWDPGSGWNWTKYMGLVTGSNPGAGPGTGVLKGVIYSGGNSNTRVSGATVSAAGQTKTTGSDGAFSFTVDPGTHKVSVSKSGSTSNSVSRTVTAGATVWASMEINAVSNKGTLTGIIYQGGNTGNRVAGATVTAGGQTATTGADG